MDTTQLMAPVKDIPLLLLVAVATVLGLGLGAGLAAATQDEPRYEYVDYYTYESQGCNAPWTETLIVEYEFC